MTRINWANEPLLSARFLCAFSECSKVPLFGTAPTRPQHPPLVFGFAPPYIFDEAGGVSGLHPSGPASPPACPCDLASLARVPFRHLKGTVFPRTVPGIPRSRRFGEGVLRGFLRLTAGLPLPPPEGGGGKRCGIPAQQPLVFPLVSASTLGFLLSQE